jgi:hypothetical protein
MQYGIALLLLASTLQAHHSTAAMYDAGKVITMRGVVSEVQWLNPHAHFTFEVTEAGGSAVKMGRGFTVYQRPGDAGLEEERSPAR